MVSGIIVCRVLQVLCLVCSVVFPFVIECIVFSWLRFFGFELSCPPLMRIMACPLFLVCCVLSVVVPVGISAAAVGPGQSAESPSQIHKM